MFLSLRFGSPYEASSTAEDGEGDSGESAKNMAVGGTGGHAGAHDDEGPVMVGLGEPEPVEVLSGSLRDLEEGQGAVSLTWRQDIWRVMRIAELRMT